MNRIAIVFLLLFAGTLPCFAAGGTNVQWTKANEFYNNKQYDSAAFYFEQIAALKPMNTEVYYNLGNTYYRLNRISLAVVNYERALKIDPENTNAGDNLALTQSRISNRIPQAGDIFFVKWWHALTMPQKSGTWAFLAFITFTLAILLILRKVVRKDNKIPVQLPVLLSILFMAFLALGYTAASNMAGHTKAVVMQPDAPLESESKNKSATLVPEGTTVVIIHDKGDMMQVALPDGRTGWMRKSQLEKI